MNKNIIWIIVILVVFGFFMIPSNSNSVNPFSIGQYKVLAGEGGVAYSFAYFNKGKTNSDVKPVVITKCDRCRGTKRVQTGDGLSTVPCPCGKDCQCGVSSEAPKRPLKQLVIVTADNCFPCLTLEKKTIPVLLKNGWKTEGELAHLKILKFPVDKIAIDGYNVYTTDEDWSYPTILVVEVIDGKDVVTAKYVGACKPSAFTKMWNKQQLQVQDVYTQQELK